MPCAGRQGGASPTGGTPLPSLPHASSASPSGALPLRSFNSRPAWHPAGPFPHVRAQRQGKHAHERPAACKAAHGVQAGGRSALCPASESGSRRHRVLRGSRAAARRPAETHGRGGEQRSWRREHGGKALPGQLSAGTDGGMRPARRAQDLSKRGSAAIPNKGPRLSSLRGERRQRPRFGGKKAAAVSQVSGQSLLG